MIDSAMFILCCCSCFAIGYVIRSRRLKSQNTESPGIIAALEHDCDLLAANCKDLRFKNDELLIDNKDLNHENHSLKKSNSILAGKNQRLENSNAQLQRRPKQ